MRGLAQPHHFNDRFSTRPVLQRGMEERLIGHGDKHIAGMAEAFIKSHCNLYTLRVSVEHERCHAELLQNLPVA
ncbi:hypothetical protein D3C74_457820 [compost metagenome]